MSKIDYQALREAAEKATKGQWAVEFDDEIYSTDSVNHEQIATVLSENESRDATFIAAANPATVLALLDELDKWRQESSAWQVVAEKQLALAASAEQKIAELESLTAPQLPLPSPVVPEEMPAHIGPREFGRPQAYIDGWNACRAAMLQSGNFRENKSSSTNNFREIAETSTNYPVIPSEVLSEIQKVAKIRADFDDFDGDRRGIGDCLDEAEQELIVTINKHASVIAAAAQQKVNK